MNTSLTPPNGGKVRRFATEQELHPALAGQIAKLANEAIAARGAFHFALAGGGSPRPLYKLLASEYREAIPWEKVHVYWGDERYVPHDHPDSNCRMARETLLNHVPVPESQIYPMPTDPADPNEAAEQYEQTLKKATGEETPRLDLILLGLGGDAHTASLFPGSEAINEKTRLVVAAEGPFEPKQRITLTAPLINKARAVYILAFGESKAEAVTNTFKSEHNPLQYPTHALQLEDGEIIWWLDDAVFKI